MDVELSCQPAYTLAYLRLRAGEEVWCEPGSMVAMSMGVSFDTRVDGSAVKALKRNILGGESFFMSRVRGEIDGAWVAVAPKFPGDVAPVPLTDADALIVQSGSYLAHEGAVEVDTKFANEGEFLLREGATMLTVQGNGVVLLGAYGGMQRIDLQPGNQVVIDTAHLVAWSKSLHLKVGPLTGFVSSAISGEGLVGQFTAEHTQGFVILQTRAEQQLRSWVMPEREQNTGR